MGVDERLLRLHYQERQQTRSLWRVYRWVGLCAALTLACLVLLTLAF